MNDEVRSTSSTAGAASAGPRILIADDDPEIREVFAEVLQLEGYEVELVDNGRAALDALRDRKRRPALMILDLNMPELSGWDVLEAIMTQSSLAGTVVLVLSGSENVASPFPRIRWMRKPILPEDLLAAIRAALGR